MNTCHLCRRNSVTRQIDFGVHPIAHRFLTSSTDQEHCHPVVLGFCGSCGLSQLIDPISPELLYSQYHVLSSWKWNPHVPRLINIIKEMPGIHAGARILEVGCNDGSFLEELKTAGFVNLHGVEPAQDAFAVASRREGMAVDSGYFNVEYAVNLSKSGRYDLVVIRQVLEHVADLEEFGNALRTVMHEGSRVLVEVPDFDFNVRWPDYSAVWEEHVNYFTRETLNRFFADNCILTEHVESAVFSGEIIIASGVFRPGSTSTSDSMEMLEEKAVWYKKRWPPFKAMFLDFLRSAGSVAIYGAGNRACGLLNFSGAGDYVATFFDDCPEKHHRFMPGSRKKILPGADLHRSEIDLCLLAVNAENEEKVLGNRQGFRGRFLSIHPPSSRLPAFWHDVNH